MIRGQSLGELAPGQVRRGLRGGLTLRTQQILLGVILGLREISPRMLTKGTASEDQPCREGMGQPFYWAGRCALPQLDSTEL